MARRPRHVSTGSTAPVTVRLLVLLVIGLAFALRVWDLDARSFWVDEGYEYRTAIVAWGRIADSVRRGLNDPPLLSYLLHSWMQIGQQEFFLRYLPLLFNVAGVAAAFTIGRQIAGHGTGLIAALLMAVVPSQIRYAQDVGQYGLMVGLLAWSTAALVTLSRRPRLGGFLVWYMAALAAAYMHYSALLAVLIPFALWLFLLLWQRRWRAFRRGAVALVAYGVGLIPLFVFFLIPQSAEETASVTGLQLGTLAGEWQRLWQSISDTIAFQIIAWPWSPLPAWLPNLLVFLILGIGLWFLSAQGRLLLAGLLITWAASYLLSRIVWYPFGFRYNLILAPFLLPLIAHGITAAATLPWGRALAPLLLFALLGGSLYMLPNRSARQVLHAHRTWNWPETEELRPIVAEWLAQWDGETPIYVYYGATPAFRYYLQRTHQDPPPHAPETLRVCTDPDDPSGFCNVPNIYFEPWHRGISGEERAAWIARAAGHPPEEFWLIVSHVHGNEETETIAALQGEYNIVQQIEALNASAYRLKRR